MVRIWYADRGPVTSKDIVCLVSHNQTVVGSNKNVLLWEFYVHLEEFTKYQSSMWVSLSVSDFFNVEFTLDKMNWENS